MQLRGTMGTSAAGLFPTSPALEATALPLTGTRNLSLGAGSSVAPAAGFSIAGAMCLLVLCLTFLLSVSFPIPSGTRAQDWRKPDVPGEEQHINALWGSLLISWMPTGFQGACQESACGGARSLQKMTLWSRTCCKSARQLSFALEPGLRGPPPGDQGMGE